MEPFVQGQEQNSEITEQKNQKQTFSFPRAAAPTPPRFDSAKKLEETLRYESQLKERVESLKGTFEFKENEWQLRIQRMDQLIANEQREKELLVERVRQSEERNAALANQFNELYHYCESLYQDVDKRRKEMEARCRQSEEAVLRMQQQVAKSEVSQEGLLAENLQLQDEVRELKSTLENKSNRRTSSLSSLIRGKECIDSAVRTFGGFQTSFQAYLESIERNGFTPVSQRTGRLFLEHWNVERENLARVTGLLTELLEKSKDAQSRDN